ncbi:hypothetical protein RFI_02707, partial [Reticulomyxa filosa]
IIFFKYLINGLPDEKEDEDNRKKYIHNKKNYWVYRSAIETITMKLSGGQFHNTFSYLINRLNREDIYNDKYTDLLKRIAQRLDEKQMKIALNHLMGKLNDKNKHQNIVIKYIQLLTENDNAYVRAELLGTIAANLNRKHFDDAFQCFTNELKDSDSSVRKSCAKSLTTLSKKWNDKQLDITVQCLVAGFQNISGYDHYIFRDLLEGIAMQLNETQIDSLFTCLINKLKNNSGQDRNLYAKSIGYFSIN